MKIRISAANMARIEFDDKLLVCINKSRLKTGKRMYTPFGGATEFYDTAKEFLDSLKVEFEKGKDLRMMIEEEKIPAFESWFYAKKERETSPYRELKEEFVDEEKVLPMLPRDAVDINYITTIKNKSISDRPGQEGIMTQRYLEMSKVKLTEPYDEMVRRELKKKDTHLGLVTEEEIRRGITDKGDSIADVCKTLLYELEK